MARSNRKRRRRSAGQTTGSKKKKSKSRSKKIPANQKKIKKVRATPLKIKDAPIMRHVDGFDPNRDINLEKAYGVLFFSTIQEAMAKQKEIKAKSVEYDQLNIVIKQEGNRVIPELEALGKVFLGEAWSIVHTRRQEDGFYG